ncbi:TPR-like protein, partial [Rhizoctonia solani]
MSNDPGVFILSVEDKSRVQETLSVNECPGISIDPIQVSSEALSRNVDILEHSADYYLRNPCLATLRTKSSLSSCLKTFEGGESSEPGDHGSVKYLASCVAELDRCFQLSGDVQELKKAIEYTIHSMKSLSENDPLLPYFLNKLGEYYCSRFDHFGQIEEVNQGLDYLSKALELESNHPKDTSFGLVGLGMTYAKRFEYCRKLEDINKSIELQTRVFSNTSYSHPDLPYWLGELGNYLAERFFELGDPEDIRKAIDYQSEGLKLTTGDDTNAYLLNSLGRSYIYRFNRTGNNKDINTAIKLLEESLTKTSTGHSDRASWLSNLGRAYNSRLSVSDNLEGIEKSVGLNSKALDVTPAGRSNIPDSLGTLAALYRNRFKITNQTVDIDKVIEYWSRALELIPVDFTDKHMYLFYLAESYDTRFQHLHNAEDIKKAIQYQTRGLELTPEGHSNVPLYLTNLGGIISSSAAYNATCELEIIKRAIDYHSRAITLLPLNHIETPSVLCRLGAMYQKRYKITSVTADIDQAIEHLSDALVLCPKEGTNHRRAHIHGTLGNAYSLRFEELLDFDDLDSATEHMSHGVALIPASHGLAAELLNALGQLHLSQFRPYPPRELRWPHLHLAIECFRKSSHCPAGSPSARFAAACKWARLSVRYSLDDSLEAYQVAMDIIPRVIWLGATIEERHSEIPSVDEIALEAAAEAIRLSEYARALEWLEQGRSIVWTQRSQLQAPINTLSSAHPKLAEELMSISKELEVVSSRVSPNQSGLAVDTSLEQTYQRHHWLADRYEHIMAEIRSLPGFEDFLRPAKASQLVRAAQEGPIILVNISTFRCDALAIIPGSDKIKHIPLPELEDGELYHARTKLERALDQQDIRERGLFHLRRPFKDPDEPAIRCEFEEILELLWERIAYPVLSTLELLKSSEGDPPHLTWCTTGLLSMLPLHACGYYTRKDKNSLTRIFDHVVSSYTPTLGALLLANRQASDSSVCPSIVAIGQKDTPGQSSLPQTVAELKCIQARVSLQKTAKFMQIINEHSTREAVLEAMETNDWVHLACHAHQDNTNANESGFFLHDGLLSIGTIRQRSFKDKGLAFLSACQTAKGDKEIADESVHIAAAMLMAGYRSVIATMWSIRDGDAPLIADKVYEYLSIDGNMDHRRSARALHVALEHLRQEVGETAFECWVPFVHIGA